MSKVSEKGIVTEPTADEIRAKPIMVSALSTSSMVMGLAAVTLLVLVYPAMIAALFAIVLGHIAILVINCNGELLGIGRARIGLLLGYGCLLLSAFLFTQLDKGRLLIRGVMASDLSAIQKTSNQYSDGILGKHERLVVENPDSAAGSNETAQELAKAFRKRLKGALKDVLELEDQKGLSWNASRLQCHCFIGRGVVLMVREPGLVGFNDAALGVLSRACWRIAAEITRDSGSFDAGFPIGICVMGKYGSQTFITGITPEVDGTITQAKYTGTDAKQVLTLFEQPVIDDE